jgi:DNA-binding CsgD family transcriptional regulator
MNHAAHGSASGSEALAELTSLLRDVHIPCWIIDDGGTFAWVNDAFIATFGDRRGEHYSTVIAPGSLETAARHFEAVQIDPGTEDEIDMMLPDGGQVHTELSSVLLEGIGLCCGVFGLAGKPARPREAAGSVLTPRQLEVLLLLAGGASTEQIARKLYLSEVTVRNHVSHILAQLGVHSRLAAVAKARTLGLIDD